MGYFTRWHQAGFSKLSILQCLELIQKEGITKPIHQVAAERDVSLTTGHDGLLSRLRGLWGKLRRFIPRVLFSFNVRDQLVHTKTPLFFRPMSVHNGSAS